MGLNHFAVHLKLTQHCTSTLLQFLNINKKNQSIKRTLHSERMRRDSGTIAPRKQPPLPPCSPPLMCFSWGPLAEA